ncbi:Putative uncharacterized protein [Lacticaseibacillus paracasei]|nr:Putative uncharacterized protein [Lacticaseibacillus paracasei]
MAVYQIRSKTILLGKTLILWL